MRIKLAFEESFGRTRCWYPISEYQKRSSIRDLIKTISKEFKLAYKNGIELELDGFTLLPRADVELTIRDGDMIRVKPYVSDSSGSKKRPFKSDKKASSNKHVTRSVTKNNRLSEDESSSSAESYDSSSEKITKKSKTSHENDSIEIVGQKEQKTRIDSSPAEEESDSSSSESSNDEDSEKESFIVEDSDSSKSSTPSSEKVKDGLNNINDRSDDSDGEKNFPNSMNESSVPPKKSLIQTTNDQSEKKTTHISTPNHNNGQRSNDLDEKINKRTKDNDLRVRDELTNKSSESKVTTDMEVETAQTINTPTKSTSEKKDSVSHYTQKTLELKPPMSLSSTSNKRKGYYQGMRNIKPTHVRFEDFDKEDEASKEFSNSVVSPQVLIDNSAVETVEQNNNSEVSRTNVANINEPMLEDQLPSPRAIVTRVDIIRQQNGLNNGQRYSNNLRKKSGKASKNKQRNNVYYLDDTHINDQDSEPMQIDVNSSSTATSSKQVIVNNSNFGPNYDQMEDYKGRPNINDIIAYKVVELSSTTWTPGLSEFKEAKIIDYDPISNQITLKHQNLDQCRKEENNSDQMNPFRNKFQIIDVDNEFTIDGQGPTPEMLSIDWVKLFSVKKVAS